MMYDLPAGRYVSMAPSRKQTAEQTREKLLQAAVQTLRRHGVNALTLDSVAREAGVSKGGLLYHFPSKDALSEAVLKQLFDTFEARVQHYHDAEAPGPGRWLRAYVRATYEEDPLPLELATMLLVAVAENRELLRLIQEDAERWRGRLADDGVPAPRAAAVRQAADAYWTERLIDPDRVDAAGRLEVMSELLELTRA